MSKFKVSKPIPENNQIENAKAENFSKGHATRTISNDFNPEAKPNRSFTIPLNDYELSLLQAIAKQNDRSQRYVARKLFRSILIKELDQNQF